MPAVRRLPLLLLAALAGCMVGPDYRRPDPLVRAAWRDSGQAGIDARPPTERWWDVFGDPVLRDLVDTAYAQNLTLRAAGLRVLEAQAQRRITVGTLYPQQQALNGGYTRTRQSANTVFGTFEGRDLDTYQASFDAAWELDVWGRFRRAIETDDANLLASVATYDDVLVTLVADVANTYLTLRVLDERLAVARDNVRVQEDSLHIARVRFEAGGTSELDVQQATTLLRDTQASIPQLEIQQRQAVDALCVLLGEPPQDLTPVLGGPGRVPDVPATVAVGIPADLLRRRPDVRAAERAAAAQSARIGVAVSDLLPAFQLVGSIGLSSQDAARFFEGRSMTASAGPSFNWAILNYGRLINNVRLQDAVFHELAVRYADTVLRAQQDVEDGLIGYVRGRARVDLLAASVQAANRAVDLSTVQYRAGATDYTSVLNTQQAKLREDDQLVSQRGSVALSVVSLFRALGGGWELREGQDFVPAATRASLEERGYWRRGAVDPDVRAREIARAETDTAEDRHWWQWRWWWPTW